jgi:HEAT repeat protein
MRRQLVTRFSVVPAILLAAILGCQRKLDYSVPSLVKILKEDKDPNMRYYAAESLGHYGPEAQSAVPDLIEALKDESAMVRMGVAYALGEIGSPDAAPALQAATKDPDKEVRVAAAAALQQIQQKDKGKGKGKKK